LHLHKKIFVIKQVYFYCAGKQAAKRQEEKIMQGMFEGGFQGEKAASAAAAQQAAPHLRVCFQAC
jgi:hypothetical protein